MAPTNPSPEFAAFPPELIARVAEQATLDAHRAADILDAVGLVPPSGKIRRLSAEFLLELSAVTRLLAWEEDGLTLHREAGLPPARDALVQTFRDAARREAEPSASATGLALSRAVFGLTLERLAWTGPTYLQAEILLGMPDEDALIDAMARFLWERRHLTPGGEGEAVP